ncbi:bifunctional 4-hydroxy-2-oxoglutarate aldolase/2-dehydro-3-deoxy-phosphogluconate aldolase [Streptomyces sioyaensis]|uniref:Bifunctional 4-hydroxy-2-oxoglutarate aldolase/2-dehydro-3-deoxy-phosphogluconate aldolase n=1 Tax=Streptomyces sioyaensis TaxID=67364 RepID=A0A4Q1R4R2_9ACTN|nr:bifunctional 4-hydroxy-2-oxoglutarate aldolase/2-dehydro-3-deoxy-phosphogluconate aldolase [Streptomyces sioyaensis]MBM4792704.1 bifunctional 4-hydroxy-2-oxoglutarate aldolase/2-dehydro-3-deoxy-phosphogluconate aldolase [Streptomyces sioyaensis]RXS67928.1 bifunctional 4-hydroxy-2-oxoglutarate aldolase/2-dehydro-3-deoxy-phosphogluconate aldolase [Streptomyces sioyaensis]
MYRWEITRAALAQRVFAIVRSRTYDEASATADTLLSAGITSLEISLTTPFALEAVTTLSRELGDDAIIGAGTVLDAVSARMAVDAGARYLVSPSLDAEVIRTGHRYGVPVFPGVSTPTEMVRGLELGADALKLFPAAAHDPSWLTEVRAALPQVPLLPTGGVTVESAPEWIAAGAVAVGMGAALSEGDRDTVAKRAADLLVRLDEAAPDRRTTRGSADLYED